MEMIVKKITFPKYSRNAFSFCISYAILCQLNSIKSYHVNDIGQIGLTGLPMMNEEMVQFSVEKPQNIAPPEPSSTGGRGKRQTGGQYIAEQKAVDVCPSVSDWVSRSEAMDPYGNTLAVAQRIPVNGTLVNQYFYETFCTHTINDSQHNNSQCLGIDKTAYRSECKERLIWTYGKVVADNGDTGWLVIAIRGSCDCGIWPNGGSNEVVNTGRGPTGQSLSKSYKRRPFLLNH